MKHISIVSGHFNPIHRGHIEYINNAKMLGTYLIAIVNSDIQVELKGSIPFMDEQHRMFIVENLKSVDEVILAIDKDRTVAATLKLLCEKYPKDKLTFFNSGDRNKKTSESLEVKTCKKCNIEYTILQLPKVCSSSELLTKCVKK